VGKDKQGCKWSVKIDARGKKSGEKRRERSGIERVEGNSVALPQ